MTLASLARWLRCPHCGEDLTPAPPLALRCVNAHSYDANKRGFVNLVPATDRMIGDSAVMLDARERFLAGGHYRPIRDAVAGSVPAAAGDVVDAGCGTGYYLEAVAADRALAFDLSAEAVRRSVRATGADGLVADTWRDLPIRSGVADAVLDVFAPRNLGEFHRILRPHGLLVVVVPTTAHLQELRASGRAIDVPAGKAERLLEDAAPSFAVQTTTRVEFTMDLTAADVAGLLGMGPSAHHRSDAPGGVRESVTASVDVVGLRRS